MVSLSILMAALCSDHHARLNSPGYPGHGLTRFLGLAILLYSKDTCWPVQVAV